MKPKDKNTTPPSKPEKPQKPPKEPKQKKDKRGSKVEHDLSQLAKDLGIRVSSPYGYYPEDVDPIIEKLQKDVASLTLENKQLSQDLENALEDGRKARNELAQVKMQMSLMEVPDISQEEGFEMLRRMDSITGNYDNESLVDVKQKLNQPAKPTGPVPKIKLKPKG